MMGMSFRRVREGDLVTVLYDPHDPTRAQLERSGGLVIILGVGQCLLGAAFCIVAFQVCSSFGGFGSVGDEPCEARRIRVCSRQVADRYVLVVPRCPDTAP